MQAQGSSALQFKRSLAPTTTPRAPGFSLLERCLRLRSIGVRVVGVLDNGLVSTPLGACSVAVTTRGHKVPDQLPQEASPRVVGHPTTALRGLWQAPIKRQAALASPRAVQDRHLSLGCECSRSVKYFCSSAVVASGTRASARVPAGKGSRRDAAIMVRHRQAAACAVAIARLPGAPSRRASRHRSCAVLPTSAVGQAARRAQNGCAAR